MPAASIQTQSVGANHVLQGNPADARARRDRERGILHAADLASTRGAHVIDLLVIDGGILLGVHGLKSLERSILGFAGIGPIRESLFGRIEQASEAKPQA